MRQGSVRPSTARGFTRPRGREAERPRRGLARNAAASCGSWAVRTWPTGCQGVDGFSIAVATGTAPASSGGPRPSGTGWYGYRPGRPARSAGCQPRHGPYARFQPLSQITIVSLDGTVIEWRGPQVATGRRRTRARGQRVLRTISSAGFDLDDVLQTVIDSAVRLTHAEYGDIALLSTATGRYEQVAYAGEYSPELLAEITSVQFRPDRLTLIGRTSWSGPVHIVDVLADPEYELPSNDRRIPDGPGRADAAERRPDRRDRRLPPGGRALHGPRDRPAEHIRRPGRPGNANVGLLPNRGTPVR